MKRKPGNQYEIGEYLVNEGLLTRKQLEDVFGMQKSTGGSLAALVVKLGFVEEGTLTAFVAKALGVEAVDVKSLVVPDVLVRKISREVLIRHQVIPVGMRGGALLLATSDPTDYAAIEEVQFLTDLPVEICLASRSGIQDALDDFFKVEDTRHDSLRLFMKGGERASKDSAFEGATPEDMTRALIPLLVEKGVITIDALVAKAKELREE